MGQPRIHQLAAEGFERAVAAYTRGRPDYPLSAVRHLITGLQLTASSRLVELGPGTGKFTQHLLEEGLHPIGIEPVDGMRNELQRRFPDLQILDGTAESIPLPAAAADAVVVAQAFHWFRGEEALAEIARVLRPAGGLGLIWNVRDESVRWIRALSAIFSAYETSAPRYQTLAWKQAFEGDVLFSPLKHAEFAHLHRIPADAIADRIASISFIATLSAPERSEIIRQVKELISTDPETRSQKEIDFPYRTHVYWCQKR